jgi:hypothetical protein
MGVRRRRSYDLRRPLGRWGWRARLAGGRRARLLLRCKSACPSSTAAARGERIGPPRGDRQLPMRSSPWEQKCRTFSQSRSLKAPFVRTRTLS